MPQDELWAASARLRGYQIRVGFDETSDGDDVVAITPHWSKQPSFNRDFRVAVAFEPYMRGHLPEVLAAVHFELVGGLPRNVPRVVRAQHRALQEGFALGSLH